ncbi:hypothetical protein LDENG_00047620 [Lucifuga dentata]|nr:hypothetical protein LDENG_00047620 [Lucifuga dentata]
MSNNTLFCPMLQAMREHTLNNNTKANLAVICLHGVFSCLGILENALILWVVGFRLQRRTVASVWVLNLAMSDFLSTLMLPLFTFYLYSSHSWELGIPVCQAQASIFFLNMFVSAFLLAAISLDRCLLVSKPVWSQNHRTVAGAWKLSTLLREDTTESWSTVRWPGGGGWSHSNGPREEHKSSGQAGKQRCERCNFGFTLPGT